MLNSVHVNGIPDAAETAQMNGHCIQEDIDTFDSNKKYNEENIFLQRLVLKIQDKVKNLNSFTL